MYGDCSRLVITKKMEEWIRRQQERNWKGFGTNKLLDDANAVMFVIKEIRMKEVCDCGYGMAALPLLFPSHASGMYKRCWIMGDNGTNDMPLLIVDTTKSGIVNNQ